MAWLFDDASTEYLRVESTPVTAAPLTLACWARSNDETAAQTCISIGDKDALTDAWDIIFAGNVAGDPIRFRAVDTTAGAADGPVDYAANTWYHVAGVEESATSRYCYVNGVAGAQDTTNRTPDNADNITIGAVANSGPSTPFSGDIAECAIWNVALTAAEIAMLALGVPAYMIRPASLVFYDDLIEGSLVDQVGGRTLTAFNTPTISTHPRMSGMPKPRIWEYTPSAPATAKGPLFDARRLAGGGILAGRLAG